MHSTRIPLSSFSEQSRAEQTAQRKGKLRLIVHKRCLWVEGPVELSVPCLHRCSPAIRPALRTQTHHLPGSCYPCQHPGGHGLRFCDRSEPPSAGECVSSCCSLKDWGERSRASSRLPASHRARPGLEGSQTCYCAWWGRSAPPEGPSPPRCGRTARRSAAPSRCRCSGGVTNASASEWGEQSHSTPRSNH